MYKTQCPWHKVWAEYQLTTTLLNGGWVLKTSRSFHYWQPAPMAGQSWQPSQEPPCRREGRHLWHWYSIKRYIKGESRQEQPRNYAQMQNDATTNTRDPCAGGQHKTTDCTGLPMLAPGMHWHWCMNKQREMQGSADPCHMHWHKCLTKHCWAWPNNDIGECTGACAKPIPQTLEGTLPDNSWIISVKSFKIQSNVWRSFSNWSLIISQKCMVTPIFVLDTNWRILTKIYFLRIVLNRAKISLY